MSRFPTERWTALAGLGFVVAYVAAFSMGVEVGPSDREIVDYYADSKHRARELVAFFLIAAAALCLLLFSHGVRKGTAFSATDAEFALDPNTRRLFESAGFLLFVCGALAAILLTTGVAVAALGHVVLPRWLGWSSVVTALLLPLAIVFIGFLIFLLWVLVISGVLAFRQEGRVSA